MRLKQVLGSVRREADRHEKQSIAGANQRGRALRRIGFPTRCPSVFPQLVIEEECDLH